MSVLTVFGWVLLAALASPFIASAVIVTRHYMRVEYYEWQARRHLKRVEELAVLIKARPFYHALKEGIVTELLDEARDGFRAKDRAKELERTWIERWGL